MHIDWFVLLCQIINFLILVYLLKYLLYGRILKAMDERQARLVRERDEAEQLQAAARQSAEAYTVKYQHLLAQADEMLNQARATADKARKELLAKARGEVDETQQRWYETLEREKQGFLEDLRRRAGTQVYDTIRQVLRDLADADLEGRILAMFLHRLESEASAHREEIHANLAQADQGEGVLIRSGFALTPEQEDRIIAALEAYAPPETPIRFEQVSAAITGIELLVHGHKIAWSVGDYLAALEEAFQEILKEEIPAAALP